MERAQGDGGVAAAMAKSFDIPISGTKGWREAQTTKGGVTLTEVDEETGASLLVPGLYFAGEALDRDYICGGFNLDHAWTTGSKAGRALGGFG
jgi:predicted flavoprotein YhiN